MNGFVVVATPCHPHSTGSIPFSVSGVSGEKHDTSFEAESVSHQSSLDTVEFARSSGSRGGRSGLVGVDVFADVEALDFNNGERRYVHHPWDWWRFVSVLMLSLDRAFLRSERGRAGD